MLELTCFFARCVLVASSDYFEAMISRSGMQEATAGLSIQLLFTRTISNLFHFIILL